MSDLSNLMDVKKILDQIGVTYWLDAGTLLLAYRDQKFDETDVDLCFYEDDFQKVQSNLQLFIEKGFKIAAFYTHPCAKATEITLARNGQKLDLWQKVKRGDKAWWLSFNGPTYIPHVVDWKFFEKLDTFEIWGEKWLIPSHTEGFLEAVYGEDWDVPDPNWNWATDPKCINYDWSIE